MRLSSSIVLGMILFSVFAESGFTQPAREWATRSNDGDEIGIIILHNAGMDV